MQIKSLITRGLCAAALATPAYIAIPAFAHEAPCPYCNMSVTQDTAAQDNEVALKIGRKRIEYKCVYCALADAKTAYTGDLSILAPSEKKDEPVKLLRQNGKWSPAATTGGTNEAAFVLPGKIKHKICDQQARAFTSTAAAQKYIDANKANLGDAKPLTLDAMLAQIDAAK